MDNPSYKSRTIFLVIFAFSFLLLALGYYLELVKDIKPCVLCMMQRGVFFLVMIISLFAAIHRPRAKARFMYLMILFILAFIGGGIAGWQLWIQASPISGEL